MLIGDKDAFYTYKKSQLLDAYINLHKIFVMKCMDLKEFVDDREKYKALDNRLPNSYKSLLEANAFSNKEEALWKLIVYNDFNDVDFIEALKNINSFCNCQDPICFEPRPRKGILRFTDEYKKWYAEIQPHLKQNFTGAKWKYDPSINMPLDLTFYKSKRLIENRSGMFVNIAEISPLLVNLNDVKTRLDEFYKIGNKSSNRSILNDFGTFFPEINGLYEKLLAIYTRKKEVSTTLIAEAKKRIGPINNFFQNHFAMPILTPIDINAEAPGQQLLGLGEELDPLLSYEDFKKEKMEMSGLESLEGSDPQESTLQGSDAQEPTSQGSDAQELTSQGSDVQEPTLQGSDAQELTSQGSDVEGSDAQEPASQGSDEQEPSSQGSYWQRFNRQRPSSKPTSQGSVQAKITSIWDNLKKPRSSLQPTSYLQRFTKYTTPRRAKTGGGRTKRTSMRMSRRCHRRRHGNRRRNKYTKRNV